MGSGGGRGVGGEARKIIPLPLARPCNRNTPAAAQNPFGEDGGDEEEWGKLIFRARKQKGGGKRRRWEEQQLNAGKGGRERLSKLGKEGRQGKRNSTIHARVLFVPAKH